MKTAIMSDFHGRDPRVEIDYLKAHGIRKFVLLGDLDSPKLWDELLKERDGLVLCIGNHDYNQAKGLEVYSGLMQFSWQEYHRQFVEEYPRAREFILSSAKVFHGRKRGVVVEYGTGKRKVAFTHGTLASLSETDPARSSVWGKIFCGDEDANIQQAFNIMEKRNYWTLFRGHDHFPAVISEEGNGFAINLNPRKIELDPNKRHIVCSGAFYDREYLIFNNLTGEVDFTRIPIA